MVTMDSAARAIDAMLHRGRAEERDGGVWLDDLGASELGSCTADEYGTPWREAAEGWEAEARRIKGEREAIIEDREAAVAFLRDVADELADLGDPEKVYDPETLAGALDRIKDIVDEALGVKS